MYYSAAGVSAHFKLTLFDKGNDLSAVLASTGMDPRVAVALLIGVPLEGLFDLAAVVAQSTLLLPEYLSAYCLM